MTCSPCIRKLNDFEISLLLAAIAVFVILILEAIFFLGPIALDLELQKIEKEQDYGMSEELMRSYRGHYSFSIAFINHPLQRHIRDELEDELVCAGSLITDDFVLTTGHCILLIDKAAPNVLVRAGNVDHRQYSVIKKCITHPEFDADSLSNDVALVEVMKKFNIKAETVKPAPVATAYSPEVSGHLKKLLLVTWNENEWHFTDILDQTIKWFPVTMIDRYVCKYNVRSLNISITNQHLCANVEIPEGMCEVSIGSPLVSRYAIIGIASKVWNCDEKIFKQSIFTNVFMYVDWINATVIG